MTDVWFTCEAGILTLSHQVDGSAAHSIHNPVATEVLFQAVE